MEFFKIKILDIRYGGLGFGGCIVGFGFYFGLIFFYRVIFLGLEYIFCFIG